MKVTANGIILLFMAIILLNCSTSQITVRKQALKKVKTVAIMPFEVVDQTSKNNQKVTIEGEEILRGALLKANFDIVEREKLLKVLAKSEVPLGAKKNDVTSVAKIENDAKVAKKTQTKMNLNHDTVELINKAKLLKADAVLVGKITDNRVIVRKIKKIIPVESNEKDKKSETKELIITQAFVKYQVFLRLVSAVDGKTILTIHNQSKPQEVEENEIPEEVLEQYRRKILSQIGDDIVSAVNKSRD